MNRKIYRNSFELDYVLNRFKITFIYNEDHQFMIESIKKLNSSYESSLSEERGVYEESVNRINSDNELWIYDNEHLKEGR